MVDTKLFQRYRGSNAKQKSMMNMLVIFPVHASMV